ncbi:hypothetical protein DERP_012806 [Dermatophagoides pteronyssinus]|uniref:Uncharacterized protein n=1 Tax=Dermatophagoides pteronyssinus TaxID=6956 RepID=A0ABQ8JFM7_DERPT|nr:hypothetical protein DERP_012806 [Dermatophagoides pteronyssinus]
MKPKQNLSFSNEFWNEIERFGFFLKTTKRIVLPSGDHCWNDFHRYFGSSSSSTTTISKSK